MFIKRGGRVCPGSGGLWPGNPINYFVIPQFKAIIILGITGLILTFAIRIDLIIEERKFKLRNLEFFYYLIHNIKSKHKLTDKNYKLILIVAKSLEWYLIKYVVINAIVVITFNYLYLCVIHKTTKLLYFTYNFISFFIDLIGNRTNNIPFLLCIAFHNNFLLQMIIWSNLPKN